MQMTSKVRSIIFGTAGAMLIAMSVVLFLVYDGLGLAFETSIVHVSDKVVIHDCEVQSKHAFLVAGTAGGILGVSIVVLVLFFPRKCRCKEVGDGNQ